MNFKIRKTETIFHGKVFDVKVDEIEYNGSGNKSFREIAAHPGGAVVLPLKSDGKIILVKQYRYPHNEVLLELPAGKLDKDEDPLKCAVRELQEETGYASNKITKLGKIYTTPGFCSEVLHIYLAENLLPGNLNREEGEEEMEIVELSLDKIEAKIRNGEIVDAKTICGIAYYKLMER